jgi:hypothetical protein
MQRESKQICSLIGLHNNVLKLGQGTTCNPSKPTESGSGWHDERQGHPGHYSVLELSVRGRIVTTTNYNATTSQGDVRHTDLVS